MHLFRQLMDILRSLFNRNLCQGTSWFINNYYGHFEKPAKWKIVKQNIKYTKEYE